MPVRREASSLCGSCWLTALWTDFRCSADHHDVSPPSGLVATQAPPGHVVMGADGAATFFTAMRAAAADRRLPPRMTIRVVAWGGDNPPFPPFPGIPAAGSSLPRFVPPSNRVAPLMRPPHDQHAAPFPRLPWIETGSAAATRATPAPTVGFRHGHGPAEPPARTRAVTAGTMPARPEAAATPVKRAARSALARRIQEIPGG
jgi:hypothetical protein